jgi:hypothetical protein
MAKLEYNQYITLWNFYFILEDLEIVPFTDANRAKIESLSEKTW